MPILGRYARTQLICPMLFELQRICTFWANNPYRGLFPSPPLFDRMPTYRTQGKRILKFLSAGLMCMHYAVHVEPGSEGEFFKRWIGGYYESGYSTNPHWNARLEPNRDHPITQAQQAAAIDDEWYFSIRFPENTQVVRLLDAVPDDQARSKNGYPPVPYPHIRAASGQKETLMWGIERPDGGRGVGFTGGHWHHNWVYDLQRNAVLVGMLWAAGATISEAGVQSAAVSEVELNTNLDPKSKMIKIHVP